jgi:hypothetical protein
MGYGCLLIGYAYVKFKKSRFELKCSRVGFGFMPFILKELKPCDARVIRLVNVSKGFSFGNFTKFRYN